MNWPRKELAFKPHRYVAIATALAFSALAINSSLGSKLPPSNPGAAIQLGVIDVVHIHNWLFACKGYEVNLNSKIDAYKTAYLKFTISRPGTKIHFRMTEDPHTTLWFHLLDKQLKFIPPEYRGEAHEQFTRDDLEPGDYYVQVLTEPNTNTRPDGTNFAHVVMQGLPWGLASDPLKDGLVSESLGTVEKNKPVRKRDALYSYQKRDLKFLSKDKDNNCPNASGAKSVATVLAREYTVDAPAGEVYVGVGETFQQNWPADYSVGMYRRAGESWIKIQNAPFQHSGGQLRLRVGFLNQPIIERYDAYFEYRLAISVGIAAANPVPQPGDPGAGATINLGPNLKPNKVLIDPIRR